MAGWNPSPASPRTPPITTTYRRRQAEAARRGLALSDCSDSPEQEELGAVFDADPEQDLSADAYQELLDACDQAQHAYALTLCETPSRSDADSLALVPTPQEEPSQRQSTVTFDVSPAAAVAMGFPASSLLLSLGPSFGRRQLTWRERPMPEKYTTFRSALKAVQQQTFIKFKQTTTSKHGRYYKCNTPGHSAKCPASK